jgi:hypothetical protein
MSVAVLRPGWQAPAVARSEAFLKAGILFAVLALTVLDRFGLRLTASWSMPAALAATYVLTAIMLFTDTARIDRRAAALFAAVVTVAGASFLLNTWFEPRALRTVTSLLLVALSYAPFVITLVPAAAGTQLWRWTLRLFATAAALVAAAGIAQFCAQFFTSAEWLFNYTPLIPEAVRTSGTWNTVHPVTSWVQADGYWIKSNGFFMREASFFSVVLAYGIVCELIIGVRRWAVVLMAAGLVLSYSGSGLVALAVALIFPLERRTLLRVLGVGACVAAVLFFLGDTLNLSYTVERIAEFGDERSSAYCRFIQPAVAVAQGLQLDPWSALLGHGPGSLTRWGMTCADLHEPTYGKLLFEYGLLGALAFGALVLLALNRSRAPLRLRIALAVSWLLVGGNLVSSEVLAMIFLFCAMWPPQAAPRKA